MAFHLHVSYTELMRVEYVHNIPTDNVGSCNQHKFSAKGRDGGSSRAMDPKPGDKRNV